MEPTGSITDNFHKAYYNSNVWQWTSWMGHQILKCPLDLWIYQEIINQQRPDIIIETGTFAGGSALYLANICDIIGKGKVITIDIEKRNDRPSHSRIKYLEGQSSTSETTFNAVNDLISQDDKVMVILDSDHSKHHVLDEMNLYGTLVSNGYYLIAEDTNVNNHPVLPNFGEGPMEAVEEYLKNNDNFEIDRSQEKFMMTFNPKGYLKKIK